ncbi:protein kinase [Sorangium sp. So ce1036]|uniref:serine/threonine-protein kinase n=1 Tax=Sorangium sp. So ce1036 TaxID=3133328 RepID=UPI003F088A31
MSATLAEGTVFAHRYRVVRLLAVGAMGSVYEAVHVETNRRRALKIMHPHLFQSDEMRERFKREAQITAGIESEYIVDVFDAGIDEATRTPFLVMELLRGEELGQRLKRAGRLPGTEVVTYLQQTALALDRTHAASIIHRDLKPENLFVTQRDDGTPRMKILDFGVAKLIAEGGTAAGATRSLGTPIYMAPEQFRAGTKLTGAVDVHALGMLAYTLLVGTPYWSQEALGAGDVIAFALVAVRGPQEPPVQRALALGVALPPAFDAWFARATAVDPAARFGAATEAVRALAEALGVAATSSGPVYTPSAPPWSAASSPTPAPAMTSAASFGAEPTPRPQGVPFSATMMETAVSSAVPAASSRTPLVAAVVVLGLGALGAGSWLLLRGGAGAEPSAGAAPDAGSASGAVIPTETAAPQAAQTAAPQAAAPSSAAAASASAAAASASAAAASASAAAASASAARAAQPSPGAGAGARRPPRTAPPRTASTAPPRASSSPARATPAPARTSAPSTRVPLLGRD